MNKPGNFNIFALSLLMFLFSACSPYPKEIQQALKLAGTNKKELEFVIKHYKKDPADSLKLKAAYFLIENMVDQYSYEGEQLNCYYKYFDSPGKRTLDSIATVCKPYSTRNLNVVWDVQNLKAGFLIRHIDFAFQSWDRTPWRKSFSFNDFCEYILPYRADNEKIECDRPEIYKQYANLLDSTHTTMEACYAVNKVLKAKGWNGTYDIAFLPHFSFKTLDKYRSGTCRDRTDYALHIMRALGIPVANDYTPQWSNRSMGHNWNVLLDEKGKMHEFIGTDYSPGEKNWQAVGTKAPKIYRRTFSIQKESLAMVKASKDEVPVFFLNSHIKDVTDKFKTCSNVTISLKKEQVGNNKYAYICVFDNKRWIPVHWGNIEYNKVTFTKMVNDSIVYLPVYFENGQLVPANSPFLLTKDGQVRYFNASNSEKKNVTLFRKYPIFLDKMYLKRMYNGKFQSSNDSSFLNSVNIFTIPEPVFDMKWYEIPVKNIPPCRYYRYLSPKKSFGNIAELEFYSNGRKLTGKTIGTPGSFLNKPEKRISSATDGNMLTFFEYSEEDGGWVGVDFEKPVVIDQIRYLPRNDGNMIIPGQKYELCFWNDITWEPIETQVARDTKLVFNNVPGNALLILHNHTEGKEERIFSYENIKQCWW